MNYHNTIYIYKESLRLRTISCQFIFIEHCIAPSSVIWCYKFYSMECTVPKSTHILLLNRRQYLSPEENTKDCPQ